METFTAEIPRTIEIFVRKADYTVTVDMQRVVAAGMLEYWLLGNQRLKDAIASMSEENGDSIDAMRGTIDKSLDAVYAGEIRRGGGGRKADPVEKRAKEIAARVARNAHKMSAKRADDWAAANFDRYLEMAATQIAAEDALETPA